MRSCALTILIFIAGLAAAQPVVTGTSDYDTASNDAPQWISIFGTGFDSTSLVTLTFGLTEFEIPPHLTEFYDHGHLRIRVGMLPKGPRWAISVRNDGTTGTRDDGQAPASGQPPSDNETEHGPTSESTIPDRPPGPIYVGPYPNSFQPQTAGVIIRSTEPEILTPTDIPRWITVLGEGFAPGATLQWGYSTPLGHEWDSLHLETVHVDSTRLMARSTIDSDTTLGHFLRVVNPDGSSSNAFTPPLTAPLDYILPPVLIDESDWRRDSITRAVESNTQAVYALMSAIDLAHIQYDCMHPIPKATNRPSIQLWRIPTEEQGPFTGEYAVRVVYCFAITQQASDIIRRIDSALDRTGLELFSRNGTGSRTGWTPRQTSIIPIMYKTFYRDTIEYAPETSNIILTFDESFYLR